MPLSLFTSVFVYPASAIILAASSPVQNHTAESLRMRTDKVGAYLSPGPRDRNCDPGVNVFAFIANLMDVDQEMEVTSSNARTTSRDRILQIDLAKSHAQHRSTTTSMSKSNSQHRYQRSNSQQRSRDRTRNIDVEFELKIVLMNSITRSRVTRATFASAAFGVPYGRRKFS